MVTPLAPTTLPAPAYFLSDAHLGAVLVPDAPRQEALLFRLLQMAGQGGGSLVLAGDLFDFWYEWNHVIPKQPFRVLCALRGLVEQGVQVYYLAGNHDFRLRGFLETEIGLHIQLDAIDARIGSQRVFVYHGDGILSRDTGYRAMKRVFRNRPIQRVFSWLHPDWSMRLARRTSVTSRTVIKQRPDDDAEYLAFARARFAEGYDGVVLGHTHRPVEHAEDGRVYVNLGDWITHFTYGLHDGAHLSLQHLKD